MPAADRQAAGRAPSSPGYRGRPLRSCLTHVERGNPVWVQPVVAGRPTARKVQLPAGNRMTREANAGAPKGDGNGDTTKRPPLAVVASNRPDTSGVLGPRGSPRGSGEFVKETMIVTSASAGTLDAATVVTVNGARDFSEDWDQVDWSRAEAEVRRLRQRIFTA